jgi:hypothetical protein
MKVWKWTALAVSGAVLLQLASCATDLAYLVLQSLATQVAAGLVGTALGATGTA